ncbi:hypothetical protein DSAG12_02980 [Promethearchaeum syntrophicum]|uniref:Uncharacterized protein n=1 Tax=Promethearchaeum syntrophicum TaxID=2594042 RepID=A0A5B9DD38_9ARCH|nr:hypothetical protein [Candidatus Prometheoarchaeum syntrophicum]QEE17148.1 hypothetical protein DSAG12_02980 [Candidatus Prometheoarchaeum syntrophicum]
MDVIEKNNKLGGLLAIIGAILGIALNYLFFTSYYKPLIAAQAEICGPGCVMVITYLLPAFTDIGIIAGVLYFIGAIGFFNKKKWAYNVAVIANVLALWTSFWPSIPILDAMGKMENGPGFFPVYIFIFLPNIILYFLINGATGKRNIGRLIVGLLTGMAFIMAFINGTASLNIMYVKGLASLDNTLYVMANRLFWLAAFGYGLITVGIMCFPKEWVRMLGIGCAIICMLFGFPMGIITTLAKGEISMYLGAPVMSLVLVLIFLIPGIWKKIIKPDEK